uniref:ATP synthase subunit d, mitochondrial n=1 Tax=Ditylenchus dipsaci TaxID=166011 RepID=A0A915DNE8_9BILA
MSQAAKRVSASSVNWAKLSERLTPHHSAELNRLKGHNSAFSAQINQLPSDLPKVNFAALKKQLPAQAALLDGLQKQYESITIPYGTIPENFNSEITKWSQFNETRSKLHEVKSADGAIEATKLEEKWSKAPPLEHFNRQHYPEYFPHLYRDYRVPMEYQIDLLQLGLNTEEIKAISARFKDYKLPRDPSKIDMH